MESRVESSNLPTRPFTDLHVAVDDLVGVDVEESVEHLLHHALHLGQLEPHPGQFGGH